MLRAPRHALLERHEILAAVDLPAVRVQGGEGDAQVVGQALLDLGPVGVGDLDVAQLEHGRLEGLPEGDRGGRRRAWRSPIPGVRDPLAHGRPYPCPDVGGGHEPAAHPLGQGSDGRDDQLGPHPGHQPVEAVRRQPPQHLHGHLHAHAVVGGSR